MEMFWEEGMRVMEGSEPRRGQPCARKSVTLLLLLLLAGKGSI
jgi:hypothetical protein